VHEQTAPTETLRTFDAAKVVADIEASTGATLDAAQREVVSEGAELLAGKLGAVPSPADASVGMYVHGPAGRGKTWLMSELFALAPVPDSAKRRVHFHAFFRTLQQRFGMRVSGREAIEATIAELLDGARLFFFDELHVHDPGGAALLNRLLDELAARGVPSLITSNYAPEGLLPNPVYHHVFEPGIRIIRERFAVRTLDAGTDYRRGESGRATRFATGRWLVASPDEASAARAAGLALPEAGEAATVLEAHHALRARAVRRSARGDRRERGLFATRRRLRQLGADRCATAVWRESGRAPAPRDPARRAR
jgi:cell division protein ZapE